MEPTDYIIDARSCDNTPNYVRAYAATLTNAAATAEALRKAGYNVISRKWDYITQQYVDFG